MKYRLWHFISAALILPTCLVVNSHPAAENDDNISVFKRKINLPTHIDQSEGTLTWAVKIDDNVKSEYIGNSVDNIARKCGLIIISSYTHLENIFLLGFNISLISKNCSNEESRLKFKFGHIGGYLKFQRSFISKLVSSNGGNIGSIVTNVETCLEASHGVMWYSQQHIRGRSKRGYQSTQNGRLMMENFQDPYFSQQWHLVGLALFCYEGI